MGSQSREERGVIVADQADRSVSPLRRPTLGGVVHRRALCSPTRAALLTGRNHHAVGFGSIGEPSDGLPWLLRVLPDGLGFVPARGLSARLEGFSLGPSGHSAGVATP